MDAIEYTFPDAELVIELVTAIESKGGGPVTEVRLHEPSANQVRQAESRLRNGVNPEAVRLYQLDLIEKASGLNRAVVDQLPITVIVQAADYLQGFITPTRKTGEN
jgi:hypothetical protein